MTTTKRAPACCTTAAAMMPIGPAPVMSTSSPSTSKAERGVHGVAERVEDGGDIEVDAGAVMPDVGHRQREILGEGAGAIHADALVSAQRWRRPARQLRQRPQTTWPSPLTMSPGMKVVHVRADLDDLADELMPDDHRHRDRLLRPGVPFVDVQIGAADAGAIARG